MNVPLSSVESCPLISCLCVTHQKPEMLRRVIGCFQCQTYPNRQLVLVYEETDLPTARYIANQSFNDKVKVIMVPRNSPELSLGALRNLSVEQADGEYLCQWDDDDWYDPERLSTQLKVLLYSGKPACILSRWIILDSCRKVAYLSNRRLWEGSIMCRRDIMVRKPYAAVSKGEDTEIIHDLYRQGHLEVIEDVPEIYVYIYHGGNTWESEHFNEIFACSTKLSEESCDQILSIVGDY